MPLPGPPIDLYGTEPTVSTIRIRVKNPHVREGIGMRNLHKWVLLLLCLVAPTVALAAFPEVTIVHTAVNVTTSTGEVLAASTDRKWALIINDSDVVIYCKIAAAAVLNEGIRLNANGGSFEISPQLGNFVTGAINCIHGGAGNKVLLVVEGQ